jgi:hypothetical protein
MSSSLTHHLPACRLIGATVVALMLGFALPQPSFAATSVAGVWRVETVKQNPNNDTATITISRAKGGNSATDKFLAISGQGVYVVTGPAATSGFGFKPTDFTRMTETGDAVLIGVQPRSKNPCGFECRSGLPEHRLTVTFNLVKQGERQFREMIASADHSAADDETW